MRYAILAMILAVQGCFRDPLLAPSQETSESGYSLVILWQRTGSDEMKIAINESIADKVITIREMDLILAIDKRESVAKKKVELFGLNKDSR